MSKMKNKNKRNDNYGGQPKQMWVRVLLVIIAVMMVMSFVALPMLSSVSAEGAEGDISVTEFTTGDLSAALTEAMNGVDRNNIKRAAVSGGTLNAADYSALCNLPNLEYIELAGAQTENGIIPDYALPSRNQLTYISLPSNTQKIGTGAFNNNKKLVKVSMPNTVTELGNNVFDGCIALNDITVPAGVTYIGEAAFRDCQSLDRFTLPAGVTEIPNYCFSKCIFTEFYIGPQVTSIGEGAFSDCHELKDVYIYGDKAPALGGGAFRNLNVTVHTADDAEGYDSWNSNFVGTAEGFNEEYIPPETAAPIETSASEETASQAVSEDKEEESSDESVSESKAEEKTENEPAATEAVSADNKTSDNGGISASTIIIVVLALALGVTITLLVVKRK